MRLYIVHDSDYCYRVVIKASNSGEAIYKLRKWLEETEQTGEFFNSDHVKWFADICDNDTIIE